MGSKVLSYRDAAELLGAKSRILARLSSLVGTGLTIASAGASEALGLFDLKQEVDRLGQEATVTLRNRFKGLNRFERSELLEAAHAVLVVSAFFAALDDLDARLGSALNTASLELTRAEQAGLASGADSRPGAAGLAELARQLIIPNAVPGLGSGWTERGVDLISFYQDLARRVGRFAAGTAVWDECDETTRDRWSTAVAEQLPQQALAQYEQRLGQLAGEFPEFAFWAQRVGVQTVLDQLYAIRRDTGALRRSLAERIGEAGTGSIVSDRQVHPIGAIATHLQAYADEPFVERETYGADFARLLDYGHRCIVLRRRNEITHLFQVVASILTCGNI